MKKYSKFSLEKILDKYIIKDPFEELLNETLNKKKLEQLIESTLQLNEFYDHKNPRSKAKVVYVSPDELPKVENGKVLGLYDPNEHKIYIANNLTPEVENFVYYHEEAHSLGIKSERLADDYAASRVGYHLRRNYDLAA